jgi:transposase
LLADLQPAGAKLGLSITQATKLLRSLRPVTTVDIERKQIAQELLEDWRWLHKRIPDVARRIRDALAAHGCTLTQIYGIGDIGAATIVAIVGDVHRFPTRGHFAAFNGTAPLDASSGDVIRHRHNRGGNRQLNKVIHLAAVTQIRNGGQGRDHYLRKLGEGKGRGEAMRSLKRQLSDVIYRRLLADARRRESVREGQCGNET